MEDIHGHITQDHGNDTVMNLTEEAQADVHGFDHPKEQTVSMFTVGDFCTPNKHA